MTFFCLNQPECSTRTRLSRRGNHSSGLYRTHVNAIMFQQKKNKGKFKYFPLTWIRFMYIWDLHTPASTRWTNFCHNISTVRHYFVIFSVETFPTILIFTAVTHFSLNRWSLIVKYVHIKKKLINSKVSSIKECLHCDHSHSIVATFLNNAKVKGKNRFYFYSALKS